jgi:hypothetical protein
MAEQAFEWRGASGRRYNYWVYPINTTFKDEPGNYIYARPNPMGGWQAVYIGQTSSLSQRLASHEKEQAAILRGGATHIHAHLSPDDRARRIEEADLVRHLLPPFNEAL